MKITNMSGFPVRSRASASERASAGSEGWIMWKAMPCRAVVIIGIAVMLVTIPAACSSNASTPSVTPPKVTSGAAGPTQGSGHFRNACALVSAADLHSLQITAHAVPSSVSVGTATTYGCAWGHPPADELHLQYESVDPAAATQVRDSLGGNGVIVPGIGDGARGQFGSVLLAVNFWKADTFVSMQFFGTGAGAHQAAFLIVAKAVASRL